MSRAEESRSGSCIAVGEFRHPFLRGPLLPSSIWEKPSLSPSPCVLAVTWVAKSGLETRLKRVLQNLAQETRREPGCVTFIVHQEATNPTRFLLYEVYRDSNSLKAHSDSRHFKRYALTEAAPLLDARERVELNVIEASYADTVGPE